MSCTLDKREGRCAGVGGTDGDRNHWPHRLLGSWGTNGGGRNTDNEAVPVPDKFTVVLAFPVMERTAERIPSPVDLKARGIVVALPGCTVIGFADAGGTKSLANAKSALLVPVIARPLMTKGAFPELVSVRVCVAALGDPTSTDPRITPAMESV